MRRLLKGPGISQRGKITRDSGVGWSTERNYERKNFDESLALAPGAGRELQATSCKLQASSRKLDKSSI